VEAADAATWLEDPMSPITTYTDESGAFVFDGVTPGTYIIGVNLRDTLTSFRSEARVLYPTSDAPQPVRIDSGQQIEIGTLQLGPPLREVPMVLRLTWEDGVPVANQSVRIEDVTGGYSPKRQRIAAFAQSDATGAIKVSGHATRTYIATLWVHERGTATEIGRSAQFEAEAAARGLVLVMTPAARQ
jgi:hypothetical protein